MALTSRPGTATTDILAAIADNPWPFVAAGVGLTLVSLNTAGFVLVSVSFTCFGLLMLRGFSRPLGWVAIVAGLFTLLGQIPPLAPLFLGANVAYIAWYIGVARRFWRATRHP